MVDRLLVELGFEQIKTYTWRQMTKQGSSTVANGD
jgi:hypothetical protein